MKINHRDTTNAVERWEGEALKILPLNPMLKSRVGVVTAQASVIQ